MKSIHLFIVTFICANLITAGVAGAQGPQRPIGSTFWDGGPTGNFLDVNSGNVGIGTSAPDSKLGVVGTGDGDIFVSHADGSLPAVQKEVFERIFDHPYDAKYWNYSLAKQVDGPGVYTGWNHHGDAFELEVILYADVPLDEIDQPPQQAQEAASIDLRFGSAVARISSGGGDMAVTGMLFSANLPDEGMQSRFMVATVEDPSSAIFNPLNLAVTPINVAPPVIPAAQMGGGTGVGPAPMTDCEKACWEEYWAKVKRARDAYGQETQDARADYDTAVAAATQQYQAIVAAANAAYQDAVDSAGDFLLAQLIVCHVQLVAGVAGCTMVGGWASLFTFGAAALAIGPCVAVAHVIYGVCTAHAITSHDNAVAQAATNRTNAIGIATNAFNSAVLAAQNALTNRINNARQRLNNAMQKATIELDDCLQRCAEG